MAVQNWLSVLILLYNSNSTTQIIKQNRLSNFSYFYMWNDAILITGPLNFIISHKIKLSLYRPGQATRAAGV